MTARNARPMHIAVVAPLWARLPPRDYGGTELRLHWLVEELVRRGHRVTLYASGDTETSAELRAVHPLNMLDAMRAGEVASYQHYSSCLLAQAIEESRDADVLHCHGDLAEMAFAGCAAPPVVYSLRTCLGPDDHWFLQRRPRATFVAMSRSQIATVPQPVRDGIPVIYNGCDFARYEFSPAPGTYLAFLGRMAPHKNPVGAIELAQAAGLPIVLAGNPQTADEERYYRASVASRIDGVCVRHIGPVGPDAKSALLRGAIALVFPIRWEEPFGLVMVEAMACGTPVLALERGSVREVIDPGITGYYADTLEELRTLVPAAAALDRHAVRRHAARRFSQRRMADRYVELYQHLALGARGPAIA